MNLSAGPVADSLQPYIDNHNLAGAVTFVADKEKVLNVETLGYADLAGQKPMQEDTLFWIASMNKAMTAAVFMMLVDEKLLSPDDEVKKYLPAFANILVKNGELLEKPSHSITIRELLTHTSGLPFATLAEKPRLDTLTLEQRAHEAAKGPLEFQPGTAYKYGNTGYNVTARVMEIVTGRPYEKLMQERLLNPLGMKDTTFWPNAWQLTRLTKSYKANSEKTGLVESEISQLTYPLDDPGRSPMPGGGFFSTGGDVVRFCQFLANDGVVNGRVLLSKAGVKEMTTRQTPADFKEAYGLGLSIYGEEYGHGGAQKTHMNIDPRGTGLIKVFLVQQDGAYPKIDDEVLMRAFDESARKIKATTQ